MTTPGLFLQMLFRRRWVAAGVYFVVVAGAVAYIFLSTPKYQSTAELVVRFGNLSIPDVQHTPATELTPADRREVVLANAEILGSHDLARGTIESMGLDTLYPDIVADPPSRGTPMDAAVQSFLDNLKVDVGLQNNVVTVSLLHPNMQLVPSIVQRLIDLYVQHVAQVYENPQLAFQQQGVETQRKRLDAAEQALDSFKVKTGITDFDQEVISLLKQRADVDTALQAAQATMSQAQQRVGDLHRAMVNIPEKVPGLSSGEQYRSLDDSRSRLADLRTKLSQMLATYAPDSPALDQVRAAIRVAERDAGARQGEVPSRTAYGVNGVFQSLQTDYFRAIGDADSGREPVRVFTEQRDGIDRRLAAMREAKGELTTLTRQAQIADDTYRTLFHQYEDAQSQDNLNKQRISRAVVTSEPTRPYKSARPRKLITLLASLVGGAILAVGAAVLLEANDDRFATAEQLHAVFGMPILATLHRVRSA
jgi:uncharacterized protein involved in exopolysaccharide biosynthesis